MKSLFRRNQTPQPFLAPLAAAGRFSRTTRRMLERMPPAAAPVAVTIVGGVLLLAVLGMLLGRIAGDAPPPVAAQESVEAPAAPEVAQEPEQEEEFAVETALDLPVAEPEPQPDPARTASILPAMPGAGTFMPPVPVAETEEEIAALEEAQRREVEADVGAPSPEETASFRQDATSLRRATATRYVNMRAGPDDDAEVLMVVPALAEIEAEDDCNWCEVVYQGRTGYIYRNFISYAD